MATVEPEAPATEQQPPATVEEEKNKPQEEEETAPKEKEEKAPLKKKKKTKQGKTASHPPYFQMIEEAIMALKEKNGSSPYAIAKYMGEKHKAELPANFRKIMALQLKNSAAKGKLVKVKASYKLSGASKMEKKSSPPVAPRKSRSAAKKPAKTEKNRKKRKMKKVPTGKPPAEASKKVGTKRTRRVMAAAAVKPKQPKSIKSPAVRKTKRARVSAI